MASKYDISIDQGATFELTLNVKNSDGSALDLSGYSARMQLRSSYASSTAAVSLTSSSGITIIGATGTINITIDAATTAGISFDRQNGKPPKGNFVYDLEIQSAAGKVTRLIYGDATVYAEVTR